MSCGADFEVHDTNIKKYQKYSPLLEISQIFYRTVEKIRTPFKEEKLLEEFHAKHTSVERQGDPGVQKNQWQQIQISVLYIELMLEERCTLNLDSQHGLLEYEVLCGRI